MPTRQRTIRLTATLLLFALTLISCGSAGGGGDMDRPGEDGTGRGATQAPPLHDTIAYVGGAGRDEIRAISPDGTNDILVWAHGRTDGDGVLSITELAWKPDAHELAFTGTHEFDCSVLHSDVYAVGSDGEGYRRLSGPPHCAALADFPQATVQVPVRNSTFDSVDLFLYFLGASEAKQVSLPPGGTGTVTFENVADLGEFVQYGMIIQGSGRQLAASAAVDVQPGATHTTAEQPVFRPAGPGWEARAPFWSPDGAEVRYAYSFDIIYEQEAQPATATLGDEVASGDPLPTIIATAGHPTDADTFLVAGWPFEGMAIGLVEGGVWTQLLSFDSWERVLGLEWLPDGSGFFFSRVEGLAGDRSDLWLYDLAAGEELRLTDLGDSFVGAMSVAPDGGRVVFEVASARDELGGLLLDPDLWILDAESGDMRLLRESASSPAWSSSGP